MNKKRTTGRLLFGWCIKYTEDHDNCRVSFTDQNGKERRCECTCHHVSSDSKKGKKSSKTGEQ